MAQGGGFSGTGKLRQFMCIEYPGLVKNVDKMLETLGGVEKISEVYCEDNRRMELRFRPDDVYCKPTCGEQHNSTALLLRVVRRKKKKKKPEEADPKVPEAVAGSSSEDPTPPEGDSSTSVRSELIGVVHTMYKFNNLCDFQYVPLVNTEDSHAQECVYDQLVPQGMEKADWLNRPAPLFLPPAAFTRMDAPQDYRYRREANSDSKSRVPQNIICRTRQRRTHFAIFHSFKDDEVPKDPLPGAMSQIRIKFMDNAFYQGLREEFDKRPIWSKNALQVWLGYSKDKLKYLLPTLSYYFHTGPWRNLWVRLGYDPRKDPNAWIYQTFDYRIRQAGGVKTKVEAKRSYSNYVLPYKSSNTSRRKTSVIQSLHLGEAGEDGNEEAAGKEKNLEELYIFRPGMIPPYRQMFYQYCDIHVPEIQKLLEEAILTGANKVCSEKYGWLPAGVEVKCRDIISHLIEKTIAERTAQGQGLDEEELRSNSDTDSPTEGNSTEEETG
ncbi:general transcription factor 3C polypeptide 5-like [Penaeus chinensis]|uniref:general transcription factor 3C polypeptide 5-like n=1 Tax=Penaeus chinensis TaxID=139456 RepID=UPI001FB67640|nr:general transcription factor 3C polypeptide 5-like [Penaeus chinensis]XP_047490173.1 general transcription factor 3C polypeptide 5-like [Penaeus chinensis]